MACALGVVSWNDFIMNEMQSDNRTFALENRPPEVPRQVTTVERAVLNYFTANGINFKPPRQ